MSGHGEKISLKEESDSLPSKVHFDSLVGGIEDLRFDENVLSIDLPTTQSLENTSLNEVVAKHMDTKIASVSDTKIDTRETFKCLYSKTFYSPELTKCFSMIVLSDM